MNKNMIGKGLKDLLQENEYASENEIVIDLPLDEVRPNPYQPRYLFNEEKIRELSESINEHGIFQPIIVKKMNGYYTIVAGERRYRACKLLGLKTIPAIVRMYETEKLIQIALIENLQREDLTPIEEAKGYLQIMRHLSLTQKEVGEKVGKSRSHITNMLGLLNLPEEVINLVDIGKISMGHARVLSKLEDAKKILKLSKMIVEQNLSVRDIEALASSEKKSNTIKVKDTNIVYKNYKHKLDSKYHIKSSVRDNKIIIESKDFKILEDIIKKLLGEDNDL